MIENKCIFPINIFLDYIDSKELIELKNNSIFYDYCPIADKTFSDNLSYISKNLDVLNDFPFLNNIIINKFKEVNLNFLQYHCDFVITKSWITRCSQGQMSLLHNHKNSFYSGVLYFDEYLDQDLDSMIEFCNPLLHLESFNLPRTFNENNFDTWRVLPEKGKILFFQSFLEHRIMRHNSSKDRYSLSFDIIPQC